MFENAVPRRAQPTVTGALRSHYTNPCLGGCVVPSMSCHCPLVRSIRTTVFLTGQSLWIRADSFPGKELPRRSPGRDIERELESVRASIE